jgi:DNA-binding IclR family transcriptional regulator
MPTKPSKSSLTEKSPRRRIPKWALHSNNVSSNEQYYLRSIGRALEVLDCFNGKSPLALKEIGIRTGLPESSLFRVLLTLEKHGYLRQAVDGTYQLAPKLRFGWIIEQGNALRDKVRPELERLAQRFNETASMAYLFDDRIHVVDSIETFHEIRMSNRIGRVLPPHCSALGKAITAFQDRGLAEQIVEVYGLTRRTDHTITDRSRLFDEFAEIRRTGIACDREESIMGRDRADQESGGGRGKGVGGAAGSELVSQRVSKLARPAELER